MRHPLPRIAFAASVLLLLVGASKTTSRIQEPKEFDRLDGHGPSGKKIDVIEWEGNLEIHSYPKGALRSLGMKIDHDSKSTKNPVMVIEYGFNGIPYTLIRRAMLTIKMPDRFLAFRDASDESYDKIIISANRVADLPTYALAPPPTQLYPDYYSEPGAPGDRAPSVPTMAGEQPAKSYEGKVPARPNEGREIRETREPASPPIQFQRADDVQQDDHGTVRRRQDKQSDEDQRIPNFSF